MRCIEIPILGFPFQLLLWINYNMRCIEMQKGIATLENDHDKLQHEMY